MESGILFYFMPELRNDIRKTQVNENEEFLVSCIYKWDYHVIEIQTQNSHVRGSTYKDELSTNLVLASINKLPATPR